MKDLVREANKHNEGNEEKVAVGRFVKLLPNILGDLLAPGDSQRFSTVMDQECGSYQQTSWYLVGNGGM